MANCYYDSYYMNKTQNLPKLWTITGHCVVNSFMGRCTTKPSNFGDCDYETKLTACPSTLCSRMFNGGIHANKSNQFIFS